MICSRCGSTKFEEQNGLFYCSYCQTQSQGVQQETDDTFVDFSKFFGKEIGTKKRIKRKAERKTGVLWTTTEAFNRILIKQMINIFEFNSKLINFKEFKGLTELIWISYMRKAGLAFTDRESNNSEVVCRRLHPASRFRDIQILTNKVTDSLPSHKNGSTDLGFFGFFRLGSDGVVRTLEETENFEDFYCNPNEEQNDYDFYDVFYDRYKDPRNYAKIRSKTIKISKESRKQLNQILSQMEPKIDTNYEYFSDSSDEDIRELKEVMDDKHFDHSIGDLSDSPKSRQTIDSNESFSDYEDYDKELLINSTKAAKLYSKHIPLSYLKNSSNISTNYFIDFMSLPKTLAILNIVFRLLSYDIYCFDLIRWANEGHIPYNNCLTCFPEDWVLIFSDFRTFTSNCVPSNKKIHILSAKIAKYIKIESFPRPDLKKLLFRFTKDFNLPKDIVSIIDSNYNMIEHFPTLVDRMSKNWGSMGMPSYERWTLLVIILVLKKIFVLNDSTEKQMSRIDDKTDDLFVWDEWETYSRLRLDLIQSHIIPIYSNDLEDIRDERLISQHYMERSETLPSPGLYKNAPYRQMEFRSEAMQEFKAINLEEAQSQTSQVLKPSLYPITNCTEFALKRINSSTLSQKLSISFEDKRLIPWTCGHEKYAFHRGYQYIGNDPQKWSQSFKLLMRLSCIELNCNTENLINILRFMEKKFFGKPRD